MSGLIFLRSTGGSYIKLSDGVNENLVLGGDPLKLLKAHANRGISSVISAAVITPEQIKGLNY